METNNNSKTNKVIISIRLLGLLCLGISLLGCENTIKVQSYIDKDSAGWAFKKNDIAFAGEKDGCRIQWNLIEPKEEDAEKYIEISGDCPFDFQGQEPIHRAIMKEISKKWSFKEFDTLLWTGSSPSLKSPWGPAMAIASSNADLRARNETLNSLFVQIANQANVYQNFRNLFQDYQADIQMTGVEKVFSFKAKDLLYADELKAAGIEEDAMVLHDAGRCEYEIHAAG